jgi:pilus assembly protein CpaE
MERPTVLLALEPAALAPTEEVLRRAGFETMRAPDGAGTEGMVHPDLAVIDCEYEPLEAELLHAWLSRSNGVKPTPVILLFGDEPPGFGGPADEYAMKPCPAEAIVYRLQALIIRAGRAAPGPGSVLAQEGGESELMGEGRVISVFAPKGGVGKTTVAVNLAVALREQTNERVLLFDADVGVGNVTAVLEVPFKMGLADLADSAPEDWTDAAFEHITTVHEATGVRVLTWGKDPADSERISVDLLLAALRWAKARHTYVIVDNHPGYDDRTMAMLTLATEIFLVVTPEVGAIRNSSQFLTLAREVGLGQIIRVVVNRANHGIAVTDMSQSLGLPIAATIVSNGPKAVVAANEGQPVILKFPRERISQDLHAVARLVTHPAVEIAPAQSRPWWARLGARASNA